MSGNRLESPNHGTIRGVLRVGGPALAAAGLLLVVTGTVSFFSSFGSFEPPRLFWCCFAGMPLLTLGAAMCKFGYLGSIARYIAAESAPVAKDAFNDLAEGASPGIRAVSRAVAEGIADSRRPDRPMP